MDEALPNVSLLIYMATYRVEECPIHRQLAFFSLFI